ncbi:hypothetical protein HCG99_11590 [Enterobacter ludwigii]|uniref:hypothetical protein n=1 Tax=Enterobacter ludwigii TaxID=299767 RepID=UPI001C8BF090|nr:hypothetical protein [Enterobacter ludwigii]MBX9044221.1 hypothetical protein [Enterobacter ludwigii]MBX9081473.1 hypothetical protein [Enterobacter ludwigii]
MKNVANVQEMLEKLVKSTHSPVYAVCSDITAYLERNPKQHNLTIGGLRAALDRSVEDDNLLIQAAFTLTGHPFKTLEVRYKLYDELIVDVLQEIDHPTYIHAKSVGNFIDEDGNDITVEELDSRIFPYFINVLHDVENLNSFSITGDE